MLPFASLAEWLIGIVLILASLGTIFVKKPVHACLCFLLSVFALAGLYLQLSAEFVAVMQILVYAGAILVIFMFVIILFQDAYEFINMNHARSSQVLLAVTALFFLLFASVFIFRIQDLNLIPFSVPKGFGEVQSLGKALYIDFFFPFEAVVLLFLVAMVGALYLGKKEVK